MVIKILGWIFLFAFCFKHTVSQNAPCESRDVTGQNQGTPTLNLHITEASASDLETNPDDYLVDTKINGLLGDSGNFGIRLVIEQSGDTPSNINVTSLFTLEARNISGDSIYQTRAFIRLNAPLDRDGMTSSTFDDIDVISFSIKCTPEGSTSSTYYSVNLAVEDVNDNTPQFVGAPYNTSANELTPIGTMILRGILATDLDNNENGDITFEIIAGSPSEATNLFSMPFRGLGIITVKNHLDFERLNSKNISGYKLVISAYDLPYNRSMTRTATTEVFISILDSDDLGPVFEDQYCVQSGKSCFNPYYLTEISEDQSLGPLKLRSAQNPSTIVNIRVRDKDTLNSSISLTIMETIPSGYENYFILESTTLEDSVSATITQRHALELKYVNAIKIIIKATEMTPNQYSDRAVIEASYERKLNTSCPSIENEPCPSVTPIVGGILGSLLLIVVIIFIGVLVFILRQQHSGKENFPEDNRPQLFIKESPVETVESLKKEVISLEEENTSLKLIIAAVKKQPRQDQEVNQP